MTNQLDMPPLPPALVTGAGQRIGAAIAAALARRGHPVVIHYRSNGDGARQLRRDILAGGGRAELVRADLCRRRERNELIGKAGEKFGPLAILVNNASVFDPDSVCDLEEAEWDRHFAVHAEAPVFLSRDFSRQLPHGWQGNIVNIIDERVLHPTPAYFSYTLSKSVLWTATKTMAQTLAPAIRVNAIGPGPVLPHSRQDQAAF